MRLFLAILAIFATASMSPAQQRDTLNFDTGLLINLNLMYEQFETEYYLCIEGIMESRTLHLVDFRMPPHKTSTPSRVIVSHGCDLYKNIVAVLHTHVDDRWSSCYLSPSDTQNVLKDNYIITIVQCGPTRYAWWFKSQVHRHRLMTPIPYFPTPSLPAIPRQTVQFDLKD